MISRTLSKPAVLAVTVLAVSFAAYAGDRPDRPHGAMKPFPMGFPINLKELEARDKQRFDLFDVNGDGTISLEELQIDSLEAKRRSLRLMAATHARNAHERRRHRREVEFGDLDQDGDGTISRDEYENHDLFLYQNRMERLFAVLDKDEDGSITISEFPGRHKLMQSLDEDGDGTISEIEMTAGRVQLEGRRKHGPWRGKPGHHKGGHEKGETPSQ